MLQLPLMNENDESPAGTTPAQVSALEQRTQITHQIPIPSEYEMRAVAFLDIMGWRDLVGYGKSIDGWRITSTS
jgi:hypothetical protein